MHCKKTRVLLSGILEVHGALNEVGDWGPLIPRCLIKEIRKLQMYVNLHESDSLFFCKRSDTQSNYIANDYVMSTGGSRINLG